MRIAVTGDTGCVGRHLSRRLTAGGHEVVAVGRSAGRPAHKIDLTRERWSPGRRHAPSTVSTTR